MNSLPLMSQTLTPQQRLKFLNNEQQLWLREARRQGRIAKRCSKTGLIAGASDAQARARKALKQARQLNVLITDLRRELREQQKQSRNGSHASPSSPIHAVSEIQVSTSR
jgi:hypothetical protein